MKAEAFTFSFPFEKEMRKKVNPSETGMKDRQMQKEREHYNYKCAKEIHIPAETCGEISAPIQRILF